MFKTSKDMARYGAVIQQPYVFQDDAICLVESLDGLRSAILRMDAAMKMMQVQQNREKSGYIMMGPKHLVEEVRKRIKENPVRKLAGTGDEAGEMAG